MTSRVMLRKCITIWGRGLGLVTHTGSLALRARARAFGATFRRCDRKSRCECFLCKTHAFRAPLSHFLHNFTFAS